MAAGDDRTASRTELRIVFGSACIAIRRESVLLLAIECNALYAPISSVFPVLFAGIWLISILPPKPKVSGSNPLGDTQLLWRCNRVAVRVLPNADAGHPPLRSCCGSRSLVPKPVCFTRGSMQRPMRICDGRYRHARSAADQVAGADQPQSKKGAEGTNYRRLRGRLRRRIGLRRPARKVFSQHCLSRVDERNSRLLESVLTRIRGCAYVTNLQLGGSA